ncbi:MAG: hypothetical protein E6R03_04265 [Hyphomicrobiaceae bacterium]|nr:MAG: hypothetical protein E6R03_04265 [Hyphomicrobiaceae bacterium]
MKDLEIISQTRYYEGDFVPRINEVGSIAIVETFNGGASRFHVFLDGNPVGRWSLSLDMALIVGLVFKYDTSPENSQAAYYFSKMIGMPE